MGIGSRVHCVAARASAALHANAVRLSRHDNPRVKGFFRSGRYPGKPRTARGLTESEENRCFPGCEQPFDASSSKQKRSQPSKKAGSPLKNDRIARSCREIDTQARSRILTHGGAPASLGASNVRTPSSRKHSLTLVETTQFAW